MDGSLTATTLPSFVYTALNLFRRFAGVFNGLPLYCLLIIFFRMLILSTNEHGLFPTTPCPCQDNSRSWIRFFFLFIYFHIFFHNVSIHSIYYTQVEAMRFKFVFQVRRTMSTRTHHC